MNQVEQLRKLVAECSCCGGTGVLLDIQTLCGECTPLREAADTLLALQTQLERVERETIVKCIAECCVLEIERVNSLGHTVMRARFPREIIAAVQALPSTAQTEQQKG